MPLAAVGLQPVAHQARVTQLVGVKVSAHIRHEARRTTPHPTVATKTKLKSRPPCAGLVQRAVVPQVVDGLADHISGEVDGDVHKP